MSSIPVNFFDAETREGFFVEEKMKRAWAAQIEVLYEIRRICKKHNIPFFADWGSLLGAVRHKGFIPWDDDLDVCMLRPDYMRFLEVAPSELSEFYEIKSLYNNPEHDNVKARIISGQYMNFDDKYLEKFHGCPYVVGIDIFPIDYITRDEAKLKSQLDTINLVLSVASSIPHTPPYNEEHLMLAGKIENMLGVKIDYNNRLDHELKKILDMLSSISSEEESDEVCSMIDLAAGWDYHIPKNAYNKSHEADFEYTTIPVPEGYETLLKTKYGEDWKTPVIGTGSHDYPFYKKQEEALKEVLEREYNKEFTDDEFQGILKASLNS